MYEEMVLRTYRHKETRKVVQELFPKKELDEQDKLWKEKGFEPGLLMDFQATEPAPARSFGSIPE